MKNQNIGKNKAQSMKKKENVDLLCGQLEGNLLQNRFQIGSFVDKGQNGKVYNVTDITKNKPQKPLVVKIVESSHKNKEEIKCLAKVWQNSKNSKAALRSFGRVPKICKYGFFFHIKEAKIVSDVTSEQISNGVLLMYIIMESFKVNLQTLFEFKKFSKDSVLSLGIQLLNIFEQIHDSGFIFNDLKLDNLMVNHNF